MAPKSKAEIGNESGKWRDLASNRGTRYPLDRGKTKAEIVGWYVEGLGPAAIIERLAARRVKVSRQAVQGFRRRHRAEIELLLAAAAEAVQTVTIADKSERIRQRDEMAGLIRAKILERGIEATELKMIGTGRNAYEVEVRRIDGPAVKAWNELLHAVAEELGELPRPEFKVDNRTLVITLEALKEIRRRAGD